MRKAKGWGKDPASSCTFTVCKLVRDEAMEVLLSQNRILQEAENWDTCEAERNESVSILATGLRTSILNFENLLFENAGGRQDTEHT